VWDPDRDNGPDKPAAEAIPVDVPDVPDGARPDAPAPGPAAGTPAPSGEAPPVAWTAQDQAAADDSASDPAAADHALVNGDEATEAPFVTAPPEPALVEAAAAGAAVQQAAQPQRRRWGRDRTAEKAAAAEDETDRNAPIVVFFILLGIVFAFVFLVAAFSTVTHINDLRQARGQDPDANLSVYLRAIGDTSGFGVMAVLCWVGAGIIGKLD
jgi:hypothetical protein